MTLRQQNACKNDFLILDASDIVRARKTRTVRIMPDIKTKDFYQRLGVARDATLEEIKSAYTQIARVYHPDSHFFDELLTEEQRQFTAEDHETFKHITEAYNTLVSKDKRVAYDKTLVSDKRNWNEPNNNQTEVRIRQKEASLRREPTKVWEKMGAVETTVKVVEKPQKETLTKPVQSVADMIQTQRRKETEMQKMVFVSPKAMLLIAGVVLLLIISGLYAFLP